MRGLLPIVSSRFLKGLRPIDHRESKGTPRSTKRKRIEPETSIDEETLPDVNFFMFINFIVLKNVIEEIGRCPLCLESIDVITIFESRMGFCNKLKIVCSKCDWSTSFLTSEETRLKQGSRGRQFSEVNIRAVVAFREIGRGHEGMNTFARLMNISGLAWTAYKNINNELQIAYENTADKSMQGVANRIKCNRDADRIDCDNSHLTVCDISLDGTWQRRGHSSLNGVVTAISNGKCLDKHVMSKYCKSCLRWESKKGSTEYNNWLIDHHCYANHKKSSGAMESAGAVAIFSSSIEKHGLIYKSYLGDGDTSSYKDVVATNPYEEYGIVPIKLEGVGHLQKRLGNGLRELRKSYKNTKTPLSGRGKLTDKVSNSLQNYYGMAIRQNKGDLYKMKKAVGAVLWHCTAFDDDDFRHRFCPVSENTWCKWQHSKITLPKWLHSIVKPIFVDLSSDELLLKCLHGRTQNANEALNNVIWQKCPKNIFVQRDMIEMGVNSAVIEFNEGASGFYDMLGQFGIPPGCINNNKKVIQKFNVGVTVQLFDK